MSLIQPFRGLRPPAERAAQVASPPYDVLSRAEARLMAAGNPYNFLHINKAEIDLPEEVDAHSEAVYAKSADNLRRFIDQGWLLADPHEALYLYRLRMGDHTQYGLVAGFSVQAYQEERIRKHELTRREKEDDRARHTEVIRANAGPVLLTYRRHSEVSAWVERMVATRVPVLYIADGHHRAASAFRVRDNLRARDPHPTGQKPYDYFLAVAFPDDQLKIMGYHRVVRDLNGLDPERFLDRLSPWFTVTPTDLPEPTGPRTFGMFLADAWYRLTPHPDLYDSADPIGALDAAILQRHLLAPILGIDDVRTSDRIDFVGGIREPDLGELFALSDYISLHLPLRPETLDLIDTDVLARET